MTILLSHPVKSFELNAPASARKVVIPKNTIVEEPIYIINTPELPVSKTLNLKTTILAEANSQATIIEVYTNTEYYPVVLHAKTEITLENGARLNHIFYQQGNANSAHTSEIQISQTKNSFYTGNFIAIEGKLNKILGNIDLNEPLAKNSLNALTYGGNNSILEMSFIVQHRKSSCESSVITRGVVFDRAKSTFTGKMVVHEGASGTKAFLENKNLLLSKEAEANSRPELAIYNDDLQCSHGATVGELDLDALFYLQSRGIPGKEAKQLLIDSFIAPCLKSIPPTFLKQIEAKLHEY